MTNKTMQELNKIEEELQAIVVDGRKEAEVYQKEVDAAILNKEEATQAAINAKQNGDAAAYIKASQEMRDAQDMEQFYLDKFNEVEDEPFITGTELSDYKSRIKSELDKIGHMKKVRAGELLKELIGIKEEVTPIFDKGDEVLYKLNHEVLRSKLPASKDDRYEDRVLIQWIDMIIRQYPSQQLTTYANEGENK